MAELSNTNYERRFSLCLAVSSSGFGKNSFESKTEFWCLLLKYSHLPSSRFTLYFYLLLLSIYFSLLRMP